MEKDHPVTQSELRAALADTKKELRSDIEASIETSRDELKEFMRGIETSLLTAFHSYAKGQTARIHGVESADADLKIRVAALEERVLSLETRRH